MGASGSQLLITKARGAAKNKSNLLKFIVINVLIELIVMLFCFAFHLRFGAKLGFFLGFANKIPDYKEERQFLTSQWQHNRK